MTIEQGTYRQRDTVTTEPAATSPTTPAAAPPAPLSPPAPPTPAAPATRPAPPAVAAESHVQTWSGSRFEPDALIAAGVGLVLTVFGLIAMIRGGFKGPMSLPVVEVLGFTHTTTLGMIEVAIGLALLASGASRSRSSEVFFGMVLGVAGFVGAVQTTSFAHSLALESSMAWLATIAGALVVAATLLLPRFTSRSTTSRQR